MAQSTMTQDTARTPSLDTVDAFDEGCDRCTARAQLRMALPGGGDLVFCGHHANRHAGDIVGAATHVWIADGFQWRGAPAAQR